MLTVFTTQWFLSYSAAFLCFLFPPIINIYCFYKENIYIFVKVQKPHSFCCFFFNVLKNNHLRISDFNFYLYFFIFHKFSTENVFRCNQENILSGLKLFCLGKTSSIVSLSSHPWSQVCERYPCNFSKQHRVSVCLPNSLILSVGSYHVPGVRPYRGQTPQKTLSMPTENSYEAVLRT